MPKEFTHWTIAEQVRRARWTRKDMVSQIIAEYPNMYLLGAMAHDSLYYPVFLPKSAGCEAAARNLHVEDITGPFRIPALRYGEAFNRPAVAFLAGAATHTVIDGVFHPFIYYFSGDSRSADPQIARNASVRHRTLETYLDLHFYGGIKLPNHGSMLALLRDKEMSDRRFYKLASLFYGNGITPGTAHTALRAHAQFVYLAQNRLWVDVVNVINAATINAFKSVRGLCYPKVEHIKSPFLTSRFTYQNPVTGDEYHASADDLRQRAISLINSVFDNFSLQLQTGADGDVFDPDSRAVLEKDAAAAAKTQMTHFDLSREIGQLLFPAAPQPKHDTPETAPAALPAQQEPQPAPDAAQPVPHAPRHHAAAAHKPAHKRAPRRLHKDGE